MNEKKSRCCFQFFCDTQQKNGLTPTEIYQQLLAAWGIDCMSRATIFRMCQPPAGPSGDVVESRGRPSSTRVPRNIEQIRQLIEDNPRLSLRGISNETGINLCDRFVFRYLKKGLRATTFTTAAEVKTESLRFLRDLPQERYVQEIRALRDHCEAVIAVQGEYIVEG